MDQESPCQSHGRVRYTPSQPLSDVNLNEQNRPLAGLTSILDPVRNASAVEKHKRIRTTTDDDLPSEARRSSAMPSFYEYSQQPTRSHEYESRRPRPRATLSTPDPRAGRSPVAQGARLPLGSPAQERSPRQAVQALQTVPSTTRQHLSGIRHTGTAHRRPSTQERKVEDPDEASLIHPNRPLRWSDLRVPKSESESSITNGTSAFVRMEEATVRDADDIRKLLKMPEIEIPPEQRSNTPREMSCKLMEHQKVALKWLKDQEKDRHKRGGLLADTMGLGKTIEALALILANRAPPADPRTTLIIAPLALLKQWDREIADKVKPAHRLTTFIYHGREKTTRKASRLFEFDIVITTYGTVSSEYKRFLEGRRRTSRIFGQDHRFHRIILDEAHRIKNRSAQCSTAVAALEANYRLCMTGTVFMNNTAEIFPLIRFLRIKPYNEWPHFSEDIDRPLRHWDEDEQAAGMRKLQVLFRSITLRRTKDSRLDGKPIITLPELTVAPTAAVFDQDQKAYYEALEKQQRIAFNKYVKKGELSKVYTFILVLLLRLRQACCHPFLIKNHGIPDEAQLNGKQMVQLAMRLAPTVVSRILRKQTFQCPLCDQAAETPVIIYPCGHDICSGCFSSMMQVIIEGRRDEFPAQLFGGTDAVCPCENCDSEIDPKKVLCHTFFLDAHAPESRSQNPGVALDDDASEVDGGSLNEDSDEGSEGDSDSLRDFIVSDGEETEDDGEEDLQTDHDSGLRSCIPRTPISSGIAKASGQVEEKLGSEAEEVEIECALEGDESERKDETEATRLDDDGDHPRGLSADSHDDLDQASGDEIGPFAQGRSVAESQPSDSEPKDTLWDSVLDRYRKFKDGMAEEDSDSYGLSLLSVKDWISTPSAKPESARTDPPRSSTAKRARSSSHHGLTAPKKRVKGDIGEAFKELAERKVEKKKKKGKGKNKCKELTLGQLRKVASGSKAAKAKYFTRLRKDFVSSAKIDVTLDLLRSMRNTKPGEKILVFSLWTSFLDLLQIPLEDEGFRFLRYDGSMTFGERDDSIKAFSEDAAVEILLVSLMAGNAGLNLTAASQVILLEPFWNPFVEDQAIDRTHRIGQKKNVDVHRVLVADTVEDQILQLQEKKRMLVDAGLSEEGAQGAGRLSLGELRGLFGF